MPDVRTIRLGLQYRTNLGSSCLTYTGQSVHLATWGPAITLVSATISSGTPPPGMEPYVCPGASSQLYMIGTPTALGTYTYQVDGLLDNGGHVLVDCVHTVALVGPPAGPGGAGCSFITITPNPPDDLLQGGDYTGAEAIQFAAAGGVGPYTWDLPEGTLPAGMAFSGAGVLSGTPTTIGSSDVVIRATDTNGCPGALSVTLEVVAPDPIVVLPVPPLEAGRRGWLYVQQFTATGGAGVPYLFEIVDSESQIPPGLTFSPLGVLAGLPTE